MGMIQCSRCHKQVDQKNTIWWPILFSHLGYYHHLSLKECGIEMDLIEEQLSLKEA